MHGKVVDARCHAKLLLKAPFVKVPQMLAHAAKLHVVGLVSRELSDDAREEIAQDVVSGQAAERLAEHLAHKRRRADGRPALGRRQAVCRSQGIVPSQNGVNAFLGRAPVLVGERTRRRLDGKLVHERLEAERVQVRLRGGSKIELGTCSGIHDVAVSRVRLVERERRTKNGLMM